MSNSTFTTAYRLIVSFGSASFNSSSCSSDTFVPVSSEQSVHPKPQFNLIHIMSLIFTSAMDSNLFILSLKLD